jgi:hypothetical protein
MTPATAPTEPSRRRGLMVAEPLRLMTPAFWYAQARLDLVMARSAVARLEAINSRTAADSRADRRYWARRRQEVRGAIVAWLVFADDSRARARALRAPRPSYLLQTVDGDEVPTTLAGFFEENDGGMLEGEREAIEALRVGETYAGGGGAAPQWSIRRTA